MAFNETVGECRFLRTTFQGRKRVTDEDGVMMEEETSVTSVRLLNIPRGKNGDKIKTGRKKHSGNVKNTSEMGLDDKNRCLGYNGLKSSFNLIQFVFQFLDHSFGQMSTLQHIYYFLRFALIWNGCCWWIGEVIAGAHSIGHLIVISF